MTIIFEGCDLVGKSTLSKHLSKITNIQYFEYFNLKKKFGDHWMNYIDFTAEVEYNALKQFPNNIILDRSFISSLIYAQVYNRPYDLSYISYDDFPDHLIIYMYLEKEILLERLNKRIEDEIIKQRILILHEAYENWFNQEKKLNVLKLNGNLNLEDQIKIIQNSSALVWNRLRKI